MRAPSLLRGLGLSRLLDLGLRRAVQLRHHGPLGFVRGHHPAQRGAADHVAVNRIRHVVVLAGDAVLLEGLEQDQVLLGLVLAGQELLGLIGVISR